jgi:hypothetical protein
MARVPRYLFGRHHAAEAEAIESGSSPGGGGGSGIDIAPNGAFGDPTQVPCFMGYFADVNDLWNLNGGDPSIYKDGCWAFASQTPGNGMPVVWILDNTDLGWWAMATDFDSVKAQARDVVGTDVPPSFRELYLPGGLAIGQTRRFKPTFAGRILGVDASVGTPPDGVVTLDVQIGGVSIFGATKHEIWSGQFVSNIPGQGADPQNMAKANFSPGSIISVTVANVQVSGSPGADAMVSFALSRVQF